MTTHSNRLIPIAAAILVLTCVTATSDARAATWPLARFVLSIDGLRTELIDDTLVVIDDATGRRICTMSSESGGVIAIVARGGLAIGEVRQSEVDMSHLDASAVGVLDVDAERRTWTLTHRFDPRRVSAADLEDLVARFVRDAQSTRLRFERELSDNR